MSLFLFGNGRYSLSVFFVVNVTTVYVDFDHVAVARPTRNVVDVRKKRTTPLILERQSCWIGDGEPEGIFKSTLNSAFVQSQRDVANLCACQK